MKNKNILIFTLVIFFFISCKSEEEKNEEEIQKVKQRKIELIKTIENDFVKQYNPIRDLDSLDFNYSYDWKKFFLKGNKLVLIKGNIDDFDISQDSIYYFSLSQYCKYIEINFIVKCSKSQFDNLYKNNEKEVVFVVKLESIDKVWYDLEVAGEEINQTFSNDLLSYDSLINYKFIPTE